MFSKRFIKYNDRASKVVNAAILALAAVLTTDLFAVEFSFTEAGAEHGLKPYEMPVGPVGGIAAADFDNDGDVDLFVPNSSPFPDQLYRNNGQGQFEEISTEVGLDLQGNHRAALWFDYNADGRLDLVIGGDCRQDPLASEPCADTADLRLFRQTASGTFEDVTAASGLDVHWGSWADGHRSGLVAGDIDNDGDLDLYVCNWNDGAWLYRNDGDGTFTDITQAAGLGNAQEDHQQPVMFDFNRDGWLDIYQAVDTFTANRLWINQRDGTFEDQATAAGLDNAMTDMGVALGDYDNDGDFDLFLTNITRSGDHDVLYRNDSVDGQLAFTEVAKAAGVADGYWNWGTTFMDADNDGWLDLAVSNGKNVGQWRSDPSLFYRNEGGTDPVFTNVSDQVGFNDEFITASLIALDFDRDGDLDVLQTTSEVSALRLMKNALTGSATTNNYLVVRPRMQGRNVYAIGAEVYVKAGDLSLMRLIQAGTSTLGQEPAEAFFGLGTQQQVEEVVVRWPGGEETRVTNIQPNQVLDVLNEPEPTSLNAGFNDAWYNASTNGQGFFIMVWPQLKQVFLSWFTFDTVPMSESTGAILGAPGQRWLTAQGSFDGLKSQLVVYSTAGGIFDKANPAPQSNIVGTIELDFESCSAGTLRFNLPGLARSGEIPIQRVVPEKIALCRSLSSLD